MRILLHTGEAPAIHTLMDGLEPEMAPQDSDEVFLFLDSKICAMVFAFQALQDGATDGFQIGIPSIKSSSPRPVSQVFNF